MSNDRVFGRAAVMGAAFLMIAGCSESPTPTSTPGSSSGHTAEATLYLAGMNHRLKIL